MPGQLRPEVEDTLDLSNSSDERIARRDAPTGTHPKKSDLDNRINKVNPKKRKRVEAGYGPPNTRTRTIPLRKDQNQEAGREPSKVPHPDRAAPKAVKGKKHGQQNGNAYSEQLTSNVAGKDSPGEKTASRHNAALVEKKRELLQKRKALPIWPHADKIRRALRGLEQNVMLLVGETGSGKSTQVPQFLLEERWCTGCIAITQPRRVAAISLARRVAEEMGSPLGSSSPASKVGYSVRFDLSVSASTKIKFLTEGMLLQELLRDPHLKQYSAVVVDEVHERSVNVDLILGFLHNLVRSDKKARGGRPLKVAVMSATADVQKLQAFFAGSRSDTAVEQAEQQVSSEASWDGVSSEDEPARQDEKALNGKVEVSADSDSVSLCYIEGRQYPVSTTYLSQPTLDFVEAALKAVFQLHLKEPLPGDILVFLTGQDTVESLQRLINEYAETMDKAIPKILALPLFAALPQTAQQRVFQPAPPRTRKVIISTNIAETSVTVPGVRFVVDSGKHKIKQFRNKLGLDSLLVKPVSQSSAIQRAGRAGREAPGKCLRLYTEKDFHAMESTGKPEILRCDLAQAIVTMKARGVDDVVGFPWLDAPPRASLEKALLQLHQLGALDDSGRITETGKVIAKLPLTPGLGRVLVEASRPERDCLLEVIDIVAGLSVENIFLNVASEELREAAEKARAELYRREGDHLTLLAAVRSYAAEQTDRKRWAEKYFVSHRAMQNVMDIRKQLTQLCKGLKLVPAHALSGQHAATAPTEHVNTPILHCILAGFASNTARLMPDGSYRTLMGNSTVAIHPSSVLFGKKVESIVFSEYVFTNKSYARGVSAVRLAWIDEALAGTPAA